MDTRQHVRDLFQFLRRYRLDRSFSIKNSKILAEFRELDSYLTDSEDEDDEDGCGLPSLRQTEFDNSVLRMARPLVAAAKANNIPGTSNTPQITLQLTRLDPSPNNAKEHDDRIPRTIEELKAMGIDVRLGERDGAVLSDIQTSKLNNPRRIQPTSQINLDLSILIALVSDLTHSVLPRTIEEVEARFTPSASYIEWKKGRLAAQGADEPVVEPKPSRALSTQALQENHRALFEEMQERLTPAIADGSVEFWTTPEAVDRCLQIVDKIGGPGEKRRALVMFPPNDQQVTVEQQQEQFWQGSRYPVGFLPLFPIRILPSSSSLETPDPPASESHTTLPSFFTALSDTCRLILSQDVIPDPRSSGSSSGTPSSYSMLSTPVPSHDDPDADIPRAAVTKANHRLTAHTVQTMLWGASRGWTTLTANKTSVKAILREMKTSGTTTWERAQESESDETDPERAALWVMEPRSLAEGMRADFVGNGEC